MKKILGYKVFNPDWTCREFQYEVGGIYEEDVTPNVCNRGFHFCKKAQDCFNYYIFDPENKVAIVEALGQIDEGGDKCATNKIHIIRHIPWSELLDLVNTGKGNSGLSNTGNLNTGNRNTGNWNTGDWNLSDRNTGCFNTEEHNLMFFDKESELTYENWYCGIAYNVMNEVKFATCEWIYEEDMTEEEKMSNPTYKTTGGYLKSLSRKDCFNDWWNDLLDNEKEIVTDIPNFDKDKFFKITGIEVE